MMFEPKELNDIKQHLFDDNYDFLHINNAQMDYVESNASNIRESIRIDLPTTTIEMHDGTVYTGEQLAYLLSKLNIMCREKFPEDFV